LVKLEVRLGLGDRIGQRERLGFPLPGGVSGTLVDSSVISLSSKAKLPSDVIWRGQGFANVSSETFQEEKARAAAKSEQISVKCFATALCETVRDLQRALGKVSVSEKAKLPRMAGSSTKQLVATLRRKTAHGRLLTQADKQPMSATSQGTDI